MGMTRQQEVPDIDPSEPILRDFLNAALVGYRQPPLQEATVLNPLNMLQTGTNCIFLCVLCVLCGSNFTAKNAKNNS